MKKIKKIKAYIGMMPDGKFSVKTIRKTKKEIIEEDKLNEEMLRKNNEFSVIYVYSKIYPCEIFIKKNEKDIES